MLCSLVHAFSVLFLYELQPKIQSSSLVKNLRTSSCSTTCHELPFIVFTLYWNATNRTHIWANPSFSLQHSKGCCIRWHLASPSNVPSPEAVFGFCNHVVHNICISAGRYKNVIKCNKVLTQILSVMLNFPKLDRFWKKQPNIKPWLHSRISRFNSGTCQPVSNFVQLQQVFFHFFPSLTPQKDSNTITHTGSWYIASA